MIYIKDYRKLSEYISNTDRKQEKFYDCIDYDTFIGKYILVHTTSGITFKGILLKNRPGCILLIVRIGNHINRFAIKAIIRKISVVAVGYHYI